MPLTGIAVCSGVFAFVMGARVWAEEEQLETGALPVDRLATARLAAREAGLFRALGHLPAAATPVFARLGEDRPAPLPVDALFDPTGELVGPPVPFRHDPEAWRAHEHAVGGHLTERLASLSRAAAYLAPGAPLVPAPPEAPYALAVSPHAVFVNPSYLAQLPPSPVALATAAALLAVPPLPDESLGACVVRFVDRCRACLTGGGCNPMLSTSTSGADECAAMAADDLRGFRLFCTAGLYERTRTCVQQPAAADDGGAGSDGGAPPGCAPAENPGRLGLESYAPLLDDPTCAGRISACLRPPAGSASPSCGEGNCGDSPRCQDACGSGCALANGPLDVACALPCEVTGGLGRMFGWRPDPPAPGEVRGGQESELCGGCGSDPPAGRPPGGAGAGGRPGTGGAGGGTPPASDEGCGSCSSDGAPGGTAGMSGGAGGRAGGAGGVVGMGGSGPGGAGTAGSGPAGAGGAGSTKSGCGSGDSRGGSGGSASADCGGCNSCSGSAQGSGCSCSGGGSSGSNSGSASCSVSSAADDLRRSRYGGAEPLMAIFLPLISLWWVARRMR